MHSEAIEMMGRPDDDAVHACVIVEKYPRSISTRIKLRRGGNKVNGAVFMTRLLQVAFRPSPHFIYGLQDFYGLFTIESKS
jgi:hypothetical protein